MEWRLRSVHVGLAEDVADPLLGSRGENGDGGGDAGGGDGADLV